VRTPRSVLVTLDRVRDVDWCRPGRSQTGPILADANPGGLGCAAVLLGFLGDRARPAGLRLAAQAWSPAIPGPVGELVPRGEGFGIVRAGHALLDRQQRLKLGPSTGRVPGLTCPVGKVMPCSEGVGMVWP